MDTVTVSQKFQIVIPKEIRQDLGIKPGRKMVVIEKQGTIHLITVNSISSVRGIAKGISTRGIRDETDRFD